LAAANKDAKPTMQAPSNKGPDLVEKAIVPDYSLSSRVAPLGLAFYTADSVPSKYRGGAFVCEHGSWDRPQFNGYKVVFVPFNGGRPSGKAEDVVTDFLNAATAIFRASSLSRPPIDLASRSCPRRAATLTTINFFEEASASIALKPSSGLRACAKNRKFVNNLKLIWVVQSHLQKYSAS
jgi:hypothetical protein